MHLKVFFPLDFKVIGLAGTHNSPHLLSNKEEVLIHPYGEMNRKMHRYPYRGRVLFSYSENMSQNHDTETSCICMYMTIVLNLCLFCSETLCSNNRTSVGNSNSIVWNGLIEYSVSVFVSTKKHSRFFFVIEYFLTESTAGWYKKYNWIHLKNWLLNGHVAKKGQD